MWNEGSQKRLLTEPDLMFKQAVETGIFKEFVAVAKDKRLRRTSDIAITREMCIRLMFQVMTVMMHWPV